MRTDQHYGRAEFLREEFGKMLTDTIGNDSELPLGEPCGAPAGSPEKIAALCRRVELGQELWHPSDNQEHRRPGLLSAGLENLEATC